MNYFFELARYEQAIRPQPDPFIDEFVEAFSSMVNSFAAKEIEMKEQIKKCPFCGSGRGESKDVFDSLRNDGSKVNLRHVVRCFDCGAQTREFGSAAAAIERWNTRLEEDRLNTLVHEFSNDLASTMREMETMIP